MLVFSRKAHDEADHDQHETNENCDDYVILHYFAEQLCDRRKRWDIDTHGRTVIFSFFFVENNLGGKDSGHWKWQVHQTTPGHQKAERKQKAESRNPKGLHFQRTTGVAVQRAGRREKHTISQPRPLPNSAGPEIAGSRFQNPVETAVTYFTRANPPRRLRWPPRSTCTYRRRSRARFRTGQAEPAH